jgi:CBS domain-containing protein
MKVGDVMARRVHLIGPDASLVVAARRMRDENVGSLPVGTGDELLGMITDRDIVVRCVAEGGSCDRTTVRDVMSAELLVGFADQPVEDAAQLMTDYGVRRLPVFDRNHRLVGIVSLNHLYGRDMRTQPHRVVFYKSLTSSAGQSRNVPLAVVHITDRHDHAQIEATAIAKFERDRGIASWREIADGYEFAEPYAPES